MKNPIRIRRLGLLLIVLASMGILFSLVGISVTWIIRPKVLTGLREITNVLESSLTTTDTGIQVLDQSINDAESNLVILQSSLDELSTALGDISSSIETSATLIGNDLQLTIINTQVALSSAATSAEIIDNTLAFIAAIPLLGADYQPDVPMHIGLEQVAAGLDEIPDTLETLEGNLNDTSSSLDVFSEDLTNLSENMDVFSSDLGEIQGTLDDYSTIVDHSLAKINAFQSHLSGYIWICCIFLSGVLLWLGVAQANVLMQGLALRNNELEVVNLADLTRE